MAEAIRLASVQCDRHPLRHLACFEELQRNATQLRHFALALRNGDQQIAASRYGDAEGPALRTVRHPQVIGPDTTVHVGDAYEIARLERSEPLAQQIEISDAIDFIVVGNPAVAIAE